MSPYTAIVVVVIVLGVVIVVVVAMLARSRFGLLVRGNWGQRAIEAETQVAPMLDENYTE